MVTVLNPFTLDVDAHSNLHGLECKDESLTVQADLQQSDINFIVKQFGLTHELPFGRAVPVYADYHDVPNDYHAAQMFVQDAEEAFMLLPAEARARFGNDAGKFLDFVADDNNRDEAVKLGFVPPSSVPLPNPADVPTQSTAAPTAKSVDDKAAGGS